MLSEAVTQAGVAGLIASLACGLGVLPLFIRRIDPARHTGVGFGFSGGLMFSASVYNLIWPGLTQLGQRAGQKMTLNGVLPVLAGILLGCLFLSVSDRMLQRRQSGDEGSWQGWGGRAGLLIFLAMTIHSIPEGVAVGVGYASSEIGGASAQLGTYLAVAIAIHNIPEGLAVAIPMRGAGASLGRCFGAAVLTSLPQPIAAVPAVLVSWFVTPIMPILMGFAAGAMIFLVMLELIPDALHDESPRRIAWSFAIGFCLMLLIQVAL
jgi:ZIP family zinc transporter